MKLSRALPALAAVLLVAGCATTTPGSGGGVPLPDPHPPADGPVFGQGTVLQVGESAPQLCLGAVAESYPPQCSGPEIERWDWTAIDLKESASGVTWGAYAVTGLWDGERFEVTEPPVPLALYDPMPQDPDPRLDPATPGAGSDAQLTDIQDELTESKPFDLLTASPQNGYVFVSVIYDDGSLQEYVDEQYGPDLVAIVSALQPVS